MRRLLLLALALAAAACGGDGSGAAGNGGTSGAAGWQGLPEDEVVTASLAFSEPLPDSTVVRLVDRAGVRPFRARISVGGLRTLREVPRRQASSEFLSRLRDELMSELRMTQCAQPGRAVAILDSWSPPGDVEAGRAALANLEDIERGVATLAEGGPYVVGIGVVGTVADLREAAADPRVATVESPAPQPDEDSDANGFVDAAPDRIPPALRDLPPEEVRARLAAVAEEVEGCGPRTDGRAPEPRE